MGHDNSIYDQVDKALQMEKCPNCDQEWPARLGSHNCNFTHRPVHNKAIIIEPRAGLLESVVRITERMETEACRAAQHADLGGDESPYPGVLEDIDATIGHLNRFRDQIRMLRGHLHKWNEDNFCLICGADGRA